MKAQQRVRLIALVALVVAAGTLAYALSNARRSYAPRQPIAFSHRRMAGAPHWETNDRGERVNTGGFSIPCAYCHTMTYKGRHSTIPSTAVCMNCHSTVGLNKEWVLKMREYWERAEPIPWVKVHDLPDFVYFDHSAHVNAKDEQGHSKLPLLDERGQPMVVCQNCHGNVAAMDLVSVQTPFNMQWCVDCHRKPAIKASTDCVTCHR
jgi:hypothetical protein